MSDKWLMSSTLYGTKPASINMNKGIIEGVSANTLGEALGHGVWLDSEFIDSVVEQGNSYKQGLKVRFGHPNMSSTALGTFLGRLKNFRRVGDQAKADLFLSNSAKEAPGGDLYNYVLNLANEDDTAFGMSIVFEQGEHYQLDKDENKIFENFDAKNKTFIELKKLLACDFVDDPAANPNGVFSAFNQTTMAAQVTEFLDTHPEVLQILDEQPEIMEKFKLRYDQYKLRKGEKMEDVKIENEEIEVVNESLESGETADVVEAKTEEVEIPETEELETISVDEVAESSLLIEFIKLADVEGYEFAREHFGKTEVEILKLKNEQLEKENEKLKNEKNESKPVKHEAAEPVVFSESSEEGNVDVRKIAKAKMKSGLSASQSWKEVKNQYPKQYKEINKTRKV